MKTKGSRRRLSKVDSPSEASAAPPRDRNSFPIVGIGGSAGGLEAFTQLLRALLTDTGMSFVFIQHLAPTHESLLTELLAKATTMPVSQVADGMRVVPDHVYVIPPNTNLTIRAGVLHLAPRPDGARPHLPVDYFFQSLAEDQGSRAIGVVLSGTASDGVLGLKAIKAAGGLAFAQDETSAAHSGMPRAAIASGYVDAILPPREIARELAEIARHPYVTLPKIGKAATLVPPDDDDLASIFTILRAAAGVDFRDYKPTTITRRVVRRMILHKLESVPAYATYLVDHPAEVEALYQDLLINVTRFFRDPELFDILTRTVFPGIIRNRTPGAPIRMWVPGCATGEEAYSILICFLECLGEVGDPGPIQMFATDLSAASIAKARAGRYPESIALDVSAERLRRFFVKTDGVYQVSKALRDLVVLAEQDVTRDPPFSKMDLISCRNVLMYFGPELQKKIFPVFHYALKPAACLILGTAESPGSLSDLFVVLDRKYRIYARRPGSGRPTLGAAIAGRGEAPSSGARRVPKRGEDIARTDWQQEADRFLLARQSPASVLVNERMDVLHVRGYTGPYLEAAQGAASLNLFKMLREGLLVAVRAAIQKAQKTRSPVRKEGVRVEQNQRLARVNIEVVSLRVPPTNTEPGAFLILFEEAGPAAKPTPAARRRPGGARRGPRAAEERRPLALKEELAATKDYLQSIIGEREAANEELRSAVEEIQSSNEEFQSTNEELETAKEELQSTNEELTTVNDELQGRNAELGQVNSDLHNVLSSVSIPMIIVGRDLRIRRFTSVTERVFNVVPTDIGRPIGEIRPKIEVPDLERVLLEVVETLIPSEQDVQDREGHWYAMRIRPYRTLDDKIDGAVLAFVDVDALRRSRERSEEARGYAEAIVETVPQPLLVLDSESRIVSCNRAFVETFHSGASPRGEILWELSGGCWDIPALRTPLSHILAERRTIEGLHVPVQFGGIGRRTLLVNARRLEWLGHAEAMMVLAIEDVTLAERLRFEALLSELSTGLIHIPASDIDAALERGLQQVGTFLGVDRGTLDTYAGGEPGVRLSWARPGLDEPPRLMDAGPFPWSAETLERGTIVRFARLDELPQAAAIDRASYVRAGTRSKVSLPLRAGGPMLGVLSFGSVRDERVWPDELVGRLHLLSQAFASALERKRVELSLAERLRFEKLLSSLLAAFSHLSAAEFDHAVQRGLRQVVDFLGVDRGSVIEFSRDGGIVRAWANEEWMDVGEFLWMTARLQRGDVVSCSQLKELQHDLTRRVKPQVAVPLLAGGLVVGGLVVGTVGAERATSDELIQQLHILGDVFANAVSRQQGEREAQRLRQELTHIGRVSTLGELTASLAHELNQPLTAILSNAQVAQRLLGADPVNLEEIREILQDIVADDKRAGEVIHRLRALIKKGNLEYVSLDLNDVVSDVARLVKGDVAFRNASMRLELAADLPRVRGDRVQLQQVVLNLVLNGLEAMREPGSGDRTLVIRTARDGAAAVEVAVQDAGIGIDESAVDRIFQPLYTTKPEGLGMGLAIARTIVAAHGGRVGAANNGHGGATFRFTVPAMTEAAQ